MTIAFLIIKLIVAFFLTAPFFSSVTFYKEAPLRFYDDDEHIKVVQKRNKKLFIVSGLLLIILGIIGHNIHGTLFTSIFAIIFIINFLQEKLAASMSPFNKQKRDALDEFNKMTKD